ncbi:MAG: hypothetical protein A2Y25_07400 [Candidatus Melainabacteria bacterium GWF2_37_15]|nr:MAG: hypothetical protein A2Y25_07400 [Candidatus Melainabacteria bacterium GWF2_37_15]
MPKALISIQLIESKIYTVRGQKVMLDNDLAALYGVETRIMNRDVKRNIERFPREFRFQLTDEEWNSLKSQFGISNESRGGRRYNPYVFTEHGVLMLSNVLNSKKAINTSVQIIKAFTKLREMAFDLNAIPQRLSELEKLLLLHIEKTDGKFEEHQDHITQIIQVLNNLIQKPDEPRRIGFRVDEK